MGASCMSKMQLNFTDQEYEEMLGLLMRDTAEFIKRLVFLVVRKKAGSTKQKKMISKLEDLLIIFLQKPEPGPGP